MPPRPGPQNPDAQAGAPPRPNEGTQNLPSSQQFPNGQYPASMLMPVPGSPGEFVVRNQAGFDLIAMIAAAREDGVTITISDGYRDLAGQQHMWELYQNGTGNLAAVPGTSNHGHGLAADINTTPEVLRWIEANGAQFGWVPYQVEGEPWHIEHTSSGAGGWQDSSGNPGGAGGGGNLGGDAAAAAGEIAGDGSRIDANAPADYRVPRGGRLFAHPRQENMWVVRYQVAPGVFIEYATADAEALRRSGYRPGQAKEYNRIGTDDRRPNAEVVNFRQTGDLSEIAWIAEEGYRTVGQWFEEAILSAFGTNEAMRNPEIQRIMLMVLQNPDMSEARLQLLIEQTEYWNGRNQTQNDWADLSEAEQDTRILNVADELAGFHRRIVGVVDGEFISMHDERIMRFAELVASGQMTLGEVVQMFEDTALGIDGSPYFRQQQAETQAQGQHAVDVENMTGQLGDLARSWGVFIADDQLATWAERIVMNQNSREDFENILETQARTMYPNLPAGVRTDSWAAPYLNTIGRVLEISPDLMDDRVQQALQSGMTVFDFQRSLMQTEDWLATGNAQDSLVSAFGQAGRIMGFV